MLPVLPVADVVEGIEWYVNVLGFTEDFRMPTDDGTFVTGQVSFHGSQMMFNLNPTDADKRGGGVFFWIRIDDVDIDAYYEELKGKGISIVQEIADQFWGDRSFTVTDLNGYILAFNKALT